MEAFLYNVGNSLGSLNKPQEALPYLKEALEIDKKLSKEDTLMRAAIMSEIGSAFNALGETQEALDYHIQALNVRKKIFSGDH